MSINASLHDTDSAAAHAAPSGSYQILAAAPKVKLNRKVVQVSGVRGQTGKGVSFTISNVGSSTLKLDTNSLSFSGTDAGQFAILPGGLPRNIAPGKRATFTVMLKATSNASVTRVLTATLNIKAAGSTTNVASVAVRGLATTGEGADKEPSLARLLELFQLDINVGDASPDTTFLDIPQGATTDQLTAPRFVKAANGYVTITPLAQFVNRTDTIASRIGTYEPGTPDSRKELFNLPGSDAQTVNPGTNGSTSFDPGTRQFSLWADFPTFIEDQQTRAVYQEEALNTFETAYENRNKVRVYPLKENGTVVPNAYVVTFEEYTLQNDQNDEVFIIRNVAVSKSQPELGLIALDGQPDPDRLAFSRIDNEDGQGFDNSVHDYSTIRIVNSGNKDLIISSLSIEDTTTNVFQITSAPSTPISLHRNSTIDVTVRFTSQGNDISQGSLRIVTNDRDEPVKDVVLTGFRQSDPELNSQGISQEPSLQEIFNTLGFRTQAISPGQHMDTNGKAEAVGDEVLADAWQAADPSKPVFIREMAGFHSQGRSDEVGWFEIGSPYYGASDPRNPGASNGPRNALWQNYPKDSQTLFPRKPSSSAYARAMFQPGDKKIGFRVVGEFSQDSLNNVPNGDLGGHHFRFYPARDENNNFIPNAWLMAMDFSSINFDYNDHVFFIQNLKPADVPVAVTGLTGVARPEGNVFDWGDVTGAAGYAVLRANKSGGPYVRITTQLLTSSDFVDTKAPAGSTRYYRIVAVDEDGDFGMPANLGVTRAPA